MPPRRGAPPDRGAPRVVQVERPSTAPAATKPTPAAATKPTPAAATKPTPANAKPTREERKAGKREKQLAAMDAKAAAEDRYFREQQSQMLRSGEARAAQMGLEGEAADAHEAALFAKQGTQGIQFGKEWPKVEVSGPGADAAPPLGDFAALGDALPPFLARNISLMRYRTPTPIQQHAVPLALAGCDLMCCAQTGSGKTAAFLVPIISSLSADGSARSTVGTAGAARPRAVVMAPTRELASQIELEAQKLTNRSALRTIAVYGGADQRAQARGLALGCDVAVATPGRLLDFTSRGIVNLSGATFLVLDEADRMLDMGFEPQIRRVVAAMPPKEQRQTLLFSATFPSSIQTLAAHFLRPYVWIGVGRVGSTVGGIQQRIWLATPDKRQKLRLVVEALAAREGRTLVFVEKKRSATWLKRMLARGGPDDAPPAERFAPVAAEDIHGDRSQSQREAALAAFREGRCRVLVATDVAARGLDVPGVEHVVNMDLPCSADDFDSYVHRIGRTGRAGHTGLATSLFVPGDAPKVGNGRLAAPLATLLREAKQEVPAFLTGGGGSGGGQRGGRAPIADARRGDASDASRQSPAVATAPQQQRAAEVDAAEERRYDEDGELYTRQEFIDEYGSTREWDRARRQPAVQRQQTEEPRRRQQQQPKAPPAAAPAPGVLRAAKKAPVAPSDPSSSGGNRNGGDVERRFDTDGGLFTRQEFVDYYGGTAEWDKARRQPSARSGSARRPRGRK